MQAVNADLCGKLGVTVCYIHHGRKNDSGVAAVDTFLGSATIVNSVRYALLIRRKTARLRTVEVANSNLGNDDIFFKAEMDEQGRIQLEYGGKVGDEDETDLTQVDKAEEILLAILGKGEEVPAHTIYSRGEAEGIHSNTMKTAKKLRNVEAFQRGKRWFGRLPQVERAKAA
jgi:hypothetical protein